MSEPSTSPYARGPLGDPGKGIRVLVALFLRLAIGITLLNTGLVGYLNANAPGMGVGMNLFIPNVGFGGLDPLMTALPYLAIGLGLALILGFMTTPTAVAAGFFSLTSPLLTTVLIISSVTAGGGMPRGFRNGFGGTPFDSMSMLLGMTSFLSGLIPNLVLIWLSPLENHPYSVDALIFNRPAGPAIVPPPPVEASAGPLEEPVGRD